MGVLAGQAVQQGLHWEGGVQPTGEDKKQTQQFDGLEFPKGPRDNTGPVLDWIQGKP